MTFALEHDLTDAVRISNTTRYGYATRDSIYSAPRFVNTTTTLITPQTQSRDTVDEILLNQSNVFAEFATGGLRHDLIAGFEVSRENSRNQLRNVTAGTPTDLFDPDPERPWNGTIVDIPGAVVRAQAETVAAYLFDTIHFSEQLLVTGGLRWEHYKSRVRPRAAPPRPLGRTDKNLTWRAGAHLQAGAPPQPLCRRRHLGESVDREHDPDNATAALVALEPERSRTYEIGAKWDGFGGRLLLNAALFRTDKVNARTAGLPGEPATVLDGKQRVDGFELGATGRITERWTSSPATPISTAKSANRTRRPKSATASPTCPSTAARCGPFTDCRRASRSAAGCVTSARATPTSPTPAGSTTTGVADATLGYDIRPRRDAASQRLQPVRQALHRPGRRRPLRPGSGPSALATLAFRR